MSEGRKQLALGHILFALWASAVASFFIARGLFAYPEVAEGWLGLNGGDDAGRSKPRARGAEEGRSEDKSLFLAR